MNLKQFVGKWENFENYFDDKSPYMIKAWELSEKTIKNKKKNLIETLLYRKGAKSFWQGACYTVNKENKTRLNGLDISINDQNLIIDWLDLNNNSIGKYTYTLDEVIEKGLEGKINYLLKTNEESPFKYVLLMEPMPEKNEKYNGGLIAHFHFQFASKKELIVNKENKLINKHWYATMCDGECTMLDRCNIVLALHKVDTWKSLD